IEPLPLSLHDALPISSVDSRHRLPETCCESSRSSPQRRLPLVTLSASLSSMPVNEVCRFASTMHTFPQTCTARVCATLKQISVRSEERRGGKDCSAWW